MARSAMQRDADAAIPYRHIRYDEFVIYEFLLPLTREGQLRRALDSLFYSDTIERRLLQIGLDRMEEIVPRAAALRDEQYIGHILALVADRFAGYSLDHVNGRYRAAGLLSQREAGDIVAQEGRYLVDETTAVVRFIVKCMSARTEYEPHLRPFRQAPEPDAAMARAGAAIEEEVRLIRALFFALFAEAVVHMVEGEDEIWLVETGPTRRLYVWEHRP